MGATLIVCDECGSDAITFDGAVLWNPKTGEFNTEEIRDRAWCGGEDCECEITRWSDKQVQQECIFDASYYD